MTSGVTKGPYMRRVISTVPEGVQQDSKSWPVVLAFAVLIEQQLERNRHKDRPGESRGWLHDNAQDLLRHAAEELQELDQALAYAMHGLMGADSEEAKERVHREAGDAAAMLMMVADRMKHLEPPMWLMQEDVVPKRRTWIARPENWSDGDRSRWLVWCAREDGSDRTVILDTETMEHARSYQDEHEASHGCVTPFSRNKPLAATKNGDVVVYGAVTGHEAGEVDVEGSGQGGWKVVCRHVGPSFDKRLELVTARAQQWVDAVQQARFHLKNYKDCRYSPRLVAMTENMGVSLDT